ncbi:hypothetical protein BYT27DRAFT_7342491 [Phlegmacium glaucopus]|nr:hypothetical protein BYT27DRAFT_7342491 [Phlegmacium glaucopus]
MSNTLTLKVKVAPKDLEIVKESKFNLCLTRNIQYGTTELEGNVVFSMVPAVKLAPNMSLSWKEKYQVYETSNSQGGFTVKVDTQIADIEGGQQADFDTNGSYKVHGVTERGKPFRVRNEWQHPACIGVNNYDATTDSYASIYISPKLPLYSTSVLLPLKNYNIFWDMRLITNTMIDYTYTDPYPFSLTDANEITLEYKDAVWSIPKQLTMSVES